MTLEVFIYCGCEESVKSQHKDPEPTENLIFLSLSVKWCRLELS